MELPQKIRDKHFLVCDDYESMRIMVSDSLRSLGITKISVARSGNDALQILHTCLQRNTPIEFVVTDLLMEDGSGIDLARGIRADPKLRHLPVLMVTSKSEAGYVVESVRAGVNNYIVKPWTMEDLMKRLIDTDQKMDKGA